MALLNDLIDIALKDIRAAAILYDKKLYAQSYFYFQQASEKANKAYGLFGGLITEDELKKSIKHNQLKIYRKAIVAEEAQIKATLKQLENNPEIIKHNFFKDKNIDAYSKKLQEGLKFHDSAKERDLLNYTKDDLDYFLEAIEELYYFRFTLGKKDKENLMSELKTYEDFGNKFFSETDKEDLKEAFKDENRDKLFNLIQNLSISQMKVLFIHFTFYFCALITIRHSNLARYPDNGKNPLNFYNMKNPSVKQQPHFMYYLKRALMQFKKIINSQ